MNLQDLSNIATIGGVLIVLIGISIIYFGKVILKTKKEMTKDWVSEVISGNLFISVIVLAGVVVFIIPKIILESISLNATFPIILKYLFYSLIFLINYIIFTYLDCRLNDSPNFKIFGMKFKKFRISKKIDNEIFFFSALTILIIYFFFIIKNYFFLIVSFVFTYLILTYLGAISGKESEGSNYDKFLEIKFISENEKPLIAKIKRWGEEFIDIIPQGEKDNEENKISINKSQIISIKKLENKK